MNCCTRFSIVGATALIAIAGTLAFAQSQPPKTPTAPKTPSVQDIKDAAAEHMPQLPPGWTMEDMAAMQAAATPGPMHAKLQEAVGTWKGQNKMWMAPGAEPVTSESMATITPMMDGKFTKCEWSGDMPGMGPFNGLGIYGYDNVGKKFQSTWIDNMGTAMMQGTGELSSDGKTLTWNFSYSCPITMKPTTMREIERITGKDTRVMEMHGVDPKSGKEYKMMEITMTRTGGAPTQAVSAPTSGR